MVDTDKSVLVVLVVLIVSIVLVKWFFKSFRSIKYLMFSKLFVEYVLVLVLKTIESMLL